MLAIRLDPDLEQRLALAARKAGKTKSAFAREAILKALSASAPVDPMVEDLKKIAAFEAEHGDDTIEFFEVDWPDWQG
jgi:predicted DNA-binding protein